MLLSCHGVQNWGTYESITKKQGKHLPNSKKKGSKFKEDVNYEALEDITLLYGTGKLEGDRIFLVNEFSEPIGQTQGKTSYTIKVQIDKHPDRTEIHSYPISEEQTIQFLNTLE